MYSKLRLLSKIVISDAVGTVFDTRYKACVPDRGVGEQVSAMSSSRKLKERIYLSRAFKLLLRQAHPTGEVERNCQHDHEARHHPKFDEHVLELFRAYPFDFSGEQ